MPEDAGTTRNCRPFTSYIAGMPSDGRQSHGPQHRAGLGIVRAKFAIGGGDEKQSGRCDDHSVVFRHEDAGIGRALFGGLCVLAQRHLPLDGSTVQVVGNERGPGRSDDDTAVGIEPPIGVVTSAGASSLRVGRAAELAVAWPADRDIESARRSSRGDYRSRRDAFFTCCTPGWRGTSKSSWNATSSRSWNAGISALPPEATTGGKSQDPVVYLWLQAAADRRSAT